MLAIVATVVLSTVATERPAMLTGFRSSPWFNEQVREQWVDDGVRVLVNASRDFDPSKPTRLIIFATPNGNSIEQTLGCATANGLDWRFDIQHVAAQIRTLRVHSPTKNIVLACVEAVGLSWPGWKQKFPDGPARVRNVVETIASWLPTGNPVRITLACHSGGGSFVWGFLDASETIPTSIESVVLLDANYSYSDADRHGDKLLAWLKTDATRRLVVVAYDDRNVKLNGKNIVSADGGTFRATERMRIRLARDCKLTESTAGEFVHRIGWHGQIALHVHTNPKEQILHTALVGEMNGLIHGLTNDWPESAWGTFGGPRAYSRFVQPAPGIPKRTANAIGGRAFIAAIEKLSRAEREAAIATEISRGNVPNMLRTFDTITMTRNDAKGIAHTVTLEVMPDYLAIGSDSDFVRVAMTPMTAAHIADVFGCSLPTRQVADDVYRAAAVKLEPRPLTLDRESPKTFLQHHDIIEEQRHGQPDGALVAGIKKDVVLSNRVAEKANRVAIYGWHKRDGTPIQPLTIVHVNWYVDYSHGVRLIKRAVTVDGRVRDIRHVLISPVLAPLLSDEGPIRFPSY